MNRYILIFTYLLFNISLISADSYWVKVVIDDDW